MRFIVAIGSFMFLLSCRDTNKHLHQEVGSKAKPLIDTLPQKFSPEKRVKTLINTEESITVSYGAVSCECAQWILEDAYGSDVSSPPKEHIYLIREDQSLPNADTIWDGVTLPLKLRLTGRFYKEHGYPPGYHPVKGDPEAARVFRYSKLTVITAKKRRTTSGLLQ